MASSCAWRIWIGRWSKYWITDTAFYHTFCELSGIAVNNSYNKKCLYIYVSIGKLDDSEYAISLGCKATETRQKGRAVNSGIRCRRRVWFCVTRTCAMCAWQKLQRFQWMFGLNRYMESEMQKRNIDKSMHVYGRNGKNCMFYTRCILDIYYKLREGFNFGYERNLNVCVVNHELNWKTIFLI